jgi:Transcriptional activator of glycolytic enzymes
LIAFKSTKMEDLTPEEIYRDYFDYQRKYAIKQIFKRHNTAWDLKEDYNWFNRRFYIIKTLICLLLNRCRLDSYEIMVITYDESSYPDGTSWEYVSVGEGIFKGWNVQIGTDGT